MHPAVLNGFRDELEKIALVTRPPAGLGSVIRRAPARPVPSGKTQEEIERLLLRKSRYAATPSSAPPMRSVDTTFTRG